MTVLILVVLAFGCLALGWIVRRSRVTIDTRYTPIHSLLSAGSSVFLPSDKGRRVTVDGYTCEIVEVLSPTSIKVRRKS
jgi:hypothetical protein